MHLYMGDLEKNFFLNEITEEEYTKITQSLFAEYRYMDASFLYNEKHIKDFSVKGKEFSFNLYKNSCYYILKGRCSLDIGENEVAILLKEEFEKTTWHSVNYEKFLEYARGTEGSVLYFISLANSIKSIGFKSSIYIEHFKCNHYGFKNGQHRTCIASKLDIPLPAYLSDMTSEDNLCLYCSNRLKKEKTTQYKQLKLQNSVNLTPLDKLLIKLNVKKHEKVFIETPLHDFENIFFKKL